MTAGRRHVVDPELIVQATLRFWNRQHPLDDACVYSLNPPGKLFRPNLMLHAAATVGGDPMSILPAAAAIEFGHVASLIHDDIIDGDTMRRGRKAVVAEYGLDKAIVAGDAMLMASFGALCECRSPTIPDERILESVKIISRSSVDMCRGQVLEEEMTGDLTASRDTYLEMAALKTGALVQTACEVGAVLAGGSSGQVTMLAEYGRLLGMAFQIVDDMLPYLHTQKDPDKGGEDDSDLRNGRITLPVIFAYENCSEGDRTTMREAFAGPLSITSAKAFHALLEQTGGLTSAKRVAVDLVAAAQNHLKELPPSPSRQELIAVASAAIHRKG